MTSGHYILGPAREASSIGLPGVNTFWNRYPEWQPSTPSTAMADYTPAAKQRAYRRCAKALRALAAELGFPLGTYEVRHCYGGPAVSGEAILHSDTLYINLPLFPDPRSAVQVHRGYFRSCAGRKDYTGGRNMWFEGYPTPSADLIRRALPDAVPTPIAWP